MDKLKRYLIKGISFLMVVIILVATPLSDYADTQGIGETHAMGSVGIIPLITGGSLMPFLGWALGVGITVAGASYIYDEYKEYVYYGGDTDLISIVDNLVEGVSELKITDKLINSFASFLENVKGLDLDSGVASTFVGAYPCVIDTLSSVPYTESFESYLSSLNRIGDVFVTWSSSDYYDSGIYYIHSAKYLESVVTSAQGYSYHAYYRVYDSNGYSTYYKGFDVEGEPTGYHRSMDKTACWFDSSANSWVLSSSPSSYQYLGNDVLTTEYIKTLVPIYKTNYLGLADAGSMSYSLIASYLDNTVISATSYGSYDQKNIDTLVSATVTGTQVEAVNTSVSTAFPQQDSSELTEEQRAALVAALVAQALAEADIASGGNQEPDDDNNNNDDNQGEVENPNLVAPPITPPEYGEDLEVGNEITVGDQAIIDQSVTNTNGIITGLNNIVSSIGNIADGIGDVLANPLGAIKTAIDSVAESVWDFFANPIGNIIELIGDIFSAILLLPSMIITDLLKPLLTELFVPDTEGLMERISILAPVVSIIDTLGKFFNCFSLVNGSEPPYMYIHFENAEDERFQSIGTLKILDMAWYEPYKPYGDLIFSCVIWLFLMLRIFKAIPSILNGMSGGGEIPDSTYEPSGDTPFAKIETRSFTMK